MAVIAHEPQHPNQTHAEVTRDVVNTLGTADRGYFIALGVAVLCLLVGIGTFTMLLGDEGERFELPPRSIVVVEPGTALKLMNESDGDGLIWIYGAPADSAAEILEE